MTLCTSRNRSISLSAIPIYRGKKFQCPHCHVTAQQTWFDADLAAEAANQIVEHVFFDHRTRIQSYQQESISYFKKLLEAANKTHISKYVPYGFSVATCLSCNKISLWVNKEMVYPKASNVSPPNDDLDNEIKDLYNEASKIVGDSPKGATALLRLALQLLLKQVGKSGKNINDDIKELVAEGLNQRIQQALDLVRVVGNNAVHPGKIDLNDGKDIAVKLFQILNFIADEMITKPKALEALYANVIPDQTKIHIDQRDSKQRA